MGTKNNPQKMETRTLEFYDAKIPPSIEVGKEKVFLVDVTRSHNGKRFTFPALYLNQFPLWFEDEGEERKSTGWYSIETGGEDNMSYSPLYMNDGDVMNLWAEIPQVN